MKFLHIQIKKVYKAYGKLQVITDFSMDFSPHRIHCLFAPSGCGKTTLLNMMAGLTKWDRGKIEGIDNKTLSYIFQEPRLLPWATVEENLLFVLESHYDKKIAKAHAEKYLALVGLLVFRNAYPKELSGGMRQRVSIARAFAYDGDTVLMDEPFKGLDFVLKKRLLKYMIENWYQKKQHVIFVTHDIEEALYLADEIHIFKGLPLTLKGEVFVDIPYEKREQEKEELQRYKKKVEDIVNQ